MTMATPPEDIYRQANRLANELNQACDAITVLQTSVISNTSKINRAIQALIEMDDAEDPRLASQLNHVMSILEGKA